MVLTPTSCDIEDYYKKLHTNPERSGKNKKYEVFYS